VHPSGSPARSCAGSARPRRGRRCGPLAGKRSRDLYFLGIGDLDRPAIEIQCVVHKTSPVDRLDDGKDLVVLAVGASDRADEPSQAVEIGRCRRRRDGRAVLEEQVDGGAVT
jgi:hypothetical protein